MSETLSETRVASTCPVGSGPVGSGSVRVRLVEFGLYLARLFLHGLIPHEISISGFQPPFPIVAHYWNRLGILSASLLWSNVAGSPLEF